MRIENGDGNKGIQHHLSKVQGAGERRDVKDPGPGDEVPADRVELSEAAKTVQQTRQLLAALPDVRLEKVADLQTKIEGGLYNVRGEQVAVKMLEYGLFDGLI